MNSRGWCAKIERFQKMRIIFILDNLYPNGKASSSRVKSYGKGLTANGVDVMVWLPAARQRYSPQPINPRPRGVDENGVAYQHMAGTSMRSKWRIVRLLQDVLGYTSTLLRILFCSKKEDIFVIYEGTVIWHLLCVNVAHAAGRKIGMELNELPYGTGAETQSAKRNRRKMLTKVFPKLDFVLAISEALADLSREYAPQAKTIKIPIIAEGHLLGESWTEPHVPYIFHSGSLYEQKDGICGMMEAFGIATQKMEQPLDFILTGQLEQSPHAEELRAIIEKYNIRSMVHFVGYLGTPELRKYQKNCTLAIINKYNTQQNKYCFSTKLSEYLSFSRPVITTTIGEANNYLKDGENAYIVEPNKPDLIADKIIQIVTNPDEAAAIGKKAHELVEREFNCNYQAERIIQALQAL